MGEALSNLLSSYDQGEASSTGIPVPVGNQSLPLTTLVIYDRITGSYRIPFGYALW